MPTFWSAALPIGEQTGRDINALTLRFTDPKLERQYRDSRLHFLFTATKTIYAVAAVTWLVFTLLNEFTIQDPSTTLLAVRIVAILGNIAAFAVALSMKPGRWVEAGIAAIVASNLVFLTLVLASMSSISLPYYSPFAIAILQGLVCFGLGITGFAEAIGRFNKFQIRGLFPAN